MSERSAVEYLSDIQRAASDALRFIGDLDSASFASDMVTYRAVAFCHFIIGESASQILARHPEFATEHPDLPWTKLVQMRDRVLDEFFGSEEVDIWTATHQQLPELLSQIEGVYHWRAQGE